MLSLAPMFFLCNGYWMLSNRQIFHSEISKIAQTDKPMLSNHTISTLIEFNPAAPVLIIVLPFLLVVFMR